MTETVLVVNAGSSSIKFQLFSVAAGDLHSIAFAPKADLQGRVVDCSKEGFLSGVALIAFLDRATDFEQERQDCRFAPPHP